MEALFPTIYFVILKLQGGVTENEISGSKDKAAAV